MTARNSISEQSSEVSAASAAQPSPRDSRWLIVIVFSGMLMRLFLLLLRPQDLQSDPDAYVALAETVLQSGGLNQPGSLQPTAFRPPLYPLLLAGLMWAGLSSTAAVAVFSLLSAAVLMIAAWWMARVAGLRGVWPAVAVLVIALDPLLLRYAVVPMTEILSAALLSVAMLNLLKAVTDEPPGRGRWAFGMQAGLCFGLAGLCRPVVFVTCAVVSGGLILAGLWNRHRGRAGDRTPNQTKVAARTGRDTLVPGLTAAIVAGLVLLPWVIRNHRQFQTFVPATTHGGYTLLLGNNEVFYNEVVLGKDSAWHGESLAVWQQQLQQSMRQDNVDLSSEVAQDRWMYARARQAIRADPAAFLKACLLRWRRFWSLTPTVNTTGSAGWLLTGTAVWYGLLWIGLAGSLFCGIHRRMDIQMLWLAILSFLLIHTFYWTNVRMRAPLSGVMTVLSAVGWQHWYRLFRRRFDRPDA